MTRDSCPSLPRFWRFVGANHLRICNILFITDLPQYIIPMGSCFMEEQAYFNDAAPNLSWLPELPSNMLLTWPATSLAFGGVHSPQPTSHRQYPVDMEHNCKPPMSDIFVEEFCLNGKGFEMMCILMHISIPLVQWIPLVTSLTSSTSSRPQRNQPSR